MTTYYTLPEWLGSREVVIVPRPEGGTRLQISGEPAEFVAIPNTECRIVIARSELTEVKPPLPPEPVDGTFALVEIDDGQVIKREIFERQIGSWWQVGDNRIGHDWDALHRRGEVTVLGVGRAGGREAVTKLIITRGLPGSGKTTWARTQPGWRVNRDALRAMVRPGWPHGDQAHEDALTSVQHALIRVLLRDRQDVIVDDTNLRQEHVDALRVIASRWGAVFVIQDFTDVPLEVCIARDAARPDPVGEAVIRRMHAQYLASREEASKP